MSLLSTVLSTCAMALLWLAAILVVAGVGRWLSIAFSLRTELRLATMFWLGLGAVVAWLFGLHLIGPLDSAVAVAPVLAAGILGWVNLWKSGWRLEPTGGRRNWPLALVIGGPFAAGILLFANLALSEPTHYDSFLYHFASIRHYAEFPAVEGLVNLHYRLGFQSATLPLAAALDLWPFNGEGYRIVNGLLVSALLIELASRLLDACVKRRLELGAGVLSVATLFLFFLPGAMVGTGSIASPSLDIGAGILFVVAFAYFADALTSRSRDTVAIALVILAVAATFRQLNLVLLVTAGSVLVVIARRDDFGWRTLSAPIAAAIIVVGVAAIHSTVVSGYPFYPASSPALGVPWAHPDTEAAAVRDEITRWAQGQLKASVSLTGPPEETLDWFRSWLGGLRESNQLGRLALLALAWLAGSVGIVIRRSRRRLVPVAGLLSLVLLPILIVWFAGAPLIRFGLGPLAAFLAVPPAVLVVDLATSGALPVRRVAIRVRQWIAPAISGALGGVLFLLTLGINVTSPQATGLAAAEGNGVIGATQPRAVDVSQMILPGGVVVMIPNRLDWCGRELWCTPYTSRGITLRGEEFSDGIERLDPDNSELSE